MFKVHRTVLVAVMLIIPMLACAMIIPRDVTAMMDGDFRYIVDDKGNATIYGYIGPGGDVVVPPTVSNGTATFPVTGIGTAAFMGMDNITSITIPDGIQSVGDYAFYGCSALGNVTIPQSVTYLGSYCFYECTGLTSAVILGNITAIRYAAFASCFHLARISLPSTIDSIVGYAFIYCASLEEMDIPDGVRSIGTHAFFNCPSLRSVVLPDSINVVDDYAFLQCQAMTSLTIGKGLEVLGDGVFMECSSLTNITMPAGLRSIGTRCFAHCGNLTGLTFLGDAPSLGQEWALDANSSLEVRFIDGAEGFSEPTWQGLPTVRTNVPDAPVHLSIISEGNNVTLSWKAPQRTGNASISAYEVFCGLDNNASSWASYGIVSGSVTSVTLRGLAVGTTYHFAVKAANIAGNSSFSDQLVYKVTDGNGGLDIIPVAIVLMVVIAGVAGVAIFVRAKGRR